MPKLHYNGSSDEKTPIEVERDLESGMKVATWLADRLLVVLTVLIEVSLPMYKFAL